MGSDWSGPATEGSRDDVALASTARRHKPRSFSYYHKAGGNGLPSTAAVETLPADHGLLVRLRSSTGRVELRGCRDAHYPAVHPNCYAPAGLREVHRLAGGGSGTAVFHGRHPALGGSVVMKHANPRDMQEVFSLAVIARELLQRRRRDGVGGGGGENEERAAAAERMKGRIPEFVMFYCSPFHVRDRGRELWSHTVRNFSDIKSSSGDESSDDDSFGGAADDLSELPERKKLIRRIRLVQGADAEHVVLDVSFKCVTLEVPGFTQENKIIEHGHAFLASLLEELLPEQQEQYWKFTVAQKRIGGPTAANGAAVLTSGKLRGDLLDRLIDDFICVIQDLRRVTWPEETQGLETVRNELKELERSKDVMAISKLANAFVGSAIKKNFAPTIGRFARLREIGDRFRRNDLMLVESEEIPARFLGALLKPNVDLGAIFVESPASQSALDCVESDYYWLELLEHATSFENGSATDRIWTCGLTDAGLHNLFLSRHRGVELFDLGEPQLSPQPAFLTKFFMSFFHVFGMEENNQGSWVRRFKVVGERLDLTEKSREKIPYCYDAFNFTMDSFVEVLFIGDEGVRELMVKYIVLQLLSDASFCLARWEEKGGGKKRFGARSSEGLDKWLWRSLWDLYIACHVHQRLLIDGSDSLQQQLTQSFSFRSVDEF